MNGSGDQSSDPPLQPSIVVPISSLASTPTLSGVVSVSSTPAIWQQHQTAIVSAPRPTVFVSNQAPTTANPGSQVVFTPSSTSLNGPIVVSSPSIVGAEGQTSTHTNGTLSAPETTLKTVPLSTLQTREATPTPFSSSTSTPNQTISPTSNPIDSSQQKQRTVFNTKSLLELVKETDPYLQIDDEAEEALTILSEEFIEKVAKQSIKMANHRGSSIVEAKDVKFCLDRDWNLFIPGLPGVEKNFKRPFILQAHKQRLALIKKRIKRS